MKILVTGSQGTLGQVLVKELRDRGHLVLGCDLYHGEKDEMRTDVSEYRQVDSVFHLFQPDAVYHLAAEFGRRNGQEYSEQLWKTNCLGTRNVIRACVKYNAHLIFASSSEAYGSLGEDSQLYENILEDRVPRFHNEYSLSKWTNEQQIRIAMKREGLRATILRFFNVYGPGEEYNEYRSVVCRFIYKMIKGDSILVNKSGKREFLYVTDWARGVANVVNDLTRFNGETFNIAGDEYYSIPELVAKIKKFLPTKSQIVEVEDELDNVREKKPYLDKAKFQLGHRCLMGLDEGLERTVGWMLGKYAN